MSEEEKKYVISTKAFTNTNTNNNVDIEGNKIINNNTKTNNTLYTINKKNNDNDNIDNLTNDDFCHDKDKESKDYLGQLHSNDKYRVKNNIYKNININNYIMYANNKINDEVLDNNDSPFYPTNQNTNINNNNHNDEYIEQQETNNTRRKDITRNRLASKQSKQSKLSRKSRQRNCNYISSHNGNENFISSFNNRKATYTNSILIQHIIQQESMKKLERIKKLKRYKTLTKQLALIFLLLDYLSFLAFSIINYLYLALVDTTTDIGVFCELFLGSIIISYFAFVLLKNKRRQVLLAIIFYAICGFVYALIILLTQIKFFDKTIMREIKYKSEFYTSKIYVVCFALNIFCWGVRVLSTISSSLFYYYNESFEVEFQVNNSSENFIYAKKSLSSKGNKLSNKAKIDIVDGNDLGNNADYEDNENNENDIDIKNIYIENESFKNNNGMSLKLSDKEYYDKLYDGNNKKTKALNKNSKNYNNNYNISEDYDINNRMNSGSTQNYQYYTKNNCRKFSSSKKFNSPYHTIANNFNNISKKDLNNSSIIDNCDAYDNNYRERFIHSDINVNACNEVETYITNKDYLNSLPNREYLVLDNNNNSNLKDYKEHNKEDISNCYSKYKGRHNIEKIKI